MFDDEIKALATIVVRDFSEAGMTVSTAESCTGGLVSAALTSIPGSSGIFEYGFVTYANLAKERMLGVSPATLTDHGAVSAQCAVEMAIGARVESGADAAVAITGIAGPDGGTKGKPVGLVYIAVSIGAEEGTFVERCEFGTIPRNDIRRQAVIKSLEILLGYACETNESDVF